MPKDYKRIVFTGDILQTNLDGTPKMAMETRWLADLLRYPVSLACPNATIEVVSWEPGAPFNGALFYQLNGMKPSVADWARLEHESNVTPAAAEYLAAFFEDALVIGNTTSSFLLRFFSERKIPYLDFILHPARFLDDVFFGIRSNIPEFFERLQRRCYPEEAIRLQAGIHAAGLRRPAPADLAPGSGLFTAQHGIDKALVSGGRFLEIEDYRQPVAAFLQRHPVVYVKPHPYARRSARVVAFLRSLAGDSGRVRIVNDNLYSLLVNPNITEVCGISSCAVYEAEYFGKPATFLSDTRVEIAGAAFDPIKYVGVYEAFFNPAFWSEVLGTSPALDLRLPPKTSRLRNLLHLYWGYGYLDWEVPLRTIGIHPPPAAPLPSASESHQSGTIAYETVRFTDALAHLSIAVVEEETAERWNDWAVAQAALGRAREAHDGFQMAVRLNPNDAQALANLGFLVAA